MSYLTSLRTKMSGSDARR